MADVEQPQPCERHQAIGGQPGRRRRDHPEMIGQGAADPPAAPQPRPGRLEILEGKEAAAVRPVEHADPHRRRAGHGGTKVGVRNGVRSNESCWQSVFHEDRSSGASAESGSTRAERNEEVDVGS